MLHLNAVEWEELLQALPGSLTLGLAGGNNGYHVPVEVLEEGKDGLGVLLEGWEGAGESAVLLLVADLFRVAHLWKGEARITNVVFNLSLEDRRLEIGLYILP